MDKINILIAYEWLALTIGTIAMITGNQVLFHLMGGQVVLAVIAIILIVQRNRRSSGAFN